jgi:hypothetical protein
MLRCLLLGRGGGGMMLLDSSLHFFGVFLSFGEQHSSRFFFFIIPVP